MRRVLLACLALGFVAGLGLDTGPVSSRSMSDRTPSSATGTLSGRWTVSLDVPGGTEKLLVTLGQDEADISGTINGASARRLHVAGEFSNGALRFCVVESGLAGTCFSGHLGTDGTLSGTVSTPDVAGIRWFARRVASPRTGSATA